MKRADSQRQQVDRSSQDAVKYRAAREVMEKIEDQIAEEEEAERSEKPGRLLVRVLAGILLLAWTVVMTWIAINALKKKEPRTNLPKSEQLARISHHEIHESHEKTFQITSWGEDRAMTRPIDCFPVVGFFRVIRVVRG